MLRYAIRTEKVRQILGLLTTVLGVRIVFFDMDDRKLQEFDDKGDSTYCSRQRMNPEFNRKCEMCDLRHLASARRSGTIEIYRCHKGLTEGIIPLFDEVHQYLGAVVFGQIRLKGRAASSTVPRHLVKSYRELPAYSPREVGNIASLLEYFVRYMMQNHLIQVRQAGWAEKLKEHIREHAADDLTVERLANAVGLSPSFISHRFKQETGLSPRKFVLKERMKRAEEMLLEGRSVKEVGLHLGFCDEFHFSRSFKSSHGVSPSKWKRRQAAEA